MSVSGNLTIREIAGQHHAMAGAWEQLSRQRHWIADYLQNPAFEETIFIGSGSSYYQAQIMASTFRHWLGRPASAFPSSEVFLFQRHAAAPGRKLLVGVSRSGESSEVVLAVRSVANRPDWTVCGITCHADSSLGRSADCLLSPFGSEKSTVMTKSFSSMTFMMQAAIARASGSSDCVLQMEAALSIGADVVTRSEAQAERIVDSNALFKNYIYLGMGPLFGAAQEACLKIKEMAYVWTESYGTLEFRHGPKSIVEKGSLVVLLLSEQARSYELKVAEEMQAYGARILILAAKAGDDTRFADDVFEIGGADLGDDARTSLYLPLLQYLGCFTALKKNVNPDEPRNLTQVVKI